MPEGPEVEATRRHIERACVGRTIEDIITVEAGGGPRAGLVDSTVLDVTDISLLRSALVGRVFASASRKGKVLYFRVGEEAFLTVHLGMTGTLSVRGLDGPRFALYSINTTDWPPKYTKLELRLSGGIQLALSDPWRFGRVTLVMGVDPLSVPPLSVLGPDAINDLPTVDEFSALIRPRRVAIKALLLQQQIVSGIGNWVADEVLYQASIHPATVAAALADDDMRRLHTSIAHVLGDACAAYSANRPFDRGWLYHYRWTKGQANPAMPDGSPITFAKVGGRTSAIVEARQGKPLALSRLCHGAAGRGCACSGQCSCKTRPPRAGGASKSVKGVSSSPALQSNANYLRLSGSASDIIVSELFTLRIAMQQWPLVLKTHLAHRAHGVYMFKFGHH